MAYENLCMYCFEDGGGQDVCPHCGRDARAAVPQVQLLPGTLLYNERFLVGRALGQDAGGIVYAALDTKRGVKIRIREYLPRDSARRLNSGEVVPESGAEDAFEGGLTKLRASVEGVDDPAKRHFFFEENGTGYIAQRKGAGADGGEMDEGRQGPNLALVIGIAAALVLAVAVGVIMLVNYLTNRTDTKAEQPRTSAEDIWSPPESPTPTPYAAATFGTITDPEQSWKDFTNPDLKGDKSDYATPSPVPTAEDGFKVDKTIGANSSTGDIKKLQKLLENLGWLSSGNITGKYDSATKQAVKDAQQYINDTYAFTPKLTVDGVAGPKTLAWLVKVDLVAKPTPTPAPITPNPTKAGQVIDENSSKEEIKYVQGQLAILGFLDNSGINGVYDKATRAAVLAFQKRVNDVQGYDALRETGVSDANTIAYLDYYVKWWQDKQAQQTPAPSAQPSPTAPLPPEGGEVIDETAPAASIKAVQEMLIALGYLDGKADGSYGQKTYTAVKSFQNFVNAQHGNKVSVTGKTDEVTRGYLEFYYENLNASSPTPAPEVKAPEIAVTGAAAYENGVYHVGAAGVKISWSAEGADNYPIYLLDEGGAEVRKQENNRATSLDFPQSYLTGTGVYTFTVVAVPPGGQIADGQRASVRLRSGEAPATTAPSATPESLTPEITVTGAQGYQNGVYQIGEAGALISWSARGAGAYSLYVTNEENEILSSQKNTAITSYQLEASGLKPGARYTFTVVAIPEGGLEKDGASASVKLTLAAGVGETSAPTATPAGDLSAPTITVSGQLGERDGIYWVGEAPISISWSAAGHVRAYSVYFKNGQGTVITGQTEISETSTSVAPEAMTPGQPYTVTVVAIPDGGSEADGKSASISIQLYAGETAKPTQAPVGAVEAPTITVSGHKDFADGVYYAAGDALAFSWSAAGEVAGYDLKIVGSDGATLYEKAGVTKTSSVLDPASMLAGTVYTLTVTAVPENGTAAEGKSASVRMALFEKKEVGAPKISVTGAAEENGSYWVDGGDVTIAWSAENAETYDVTVEKSDGTSRALLTGSKDKSITVKAADFLEGISYRVTVTAIPAGGAAADGKSASVLLARREVVAEVEAPKISLSGHAGEQNGIYLVGEQTLGVSWSAQNAAAYSLYLYDGSGGLMNAVEMTANTQVSIKPADLLAGQTYKLTVVAIPKGGKEEDGKSASISFALAEKQVPQVGAPEIGISGHEAFADGIYWKGDADLKITWRADNAATYRAVLTDSAGTTVTDTESTKDTSATLTSKKLAEGEIYTLTVYAAPEGGGRDDIQSASVRVALAQPEEGPDEDPSEADRIDKNSNSADIERMQVKLYELGWLPGEATAERGQLGPMTRQAVYDFQMYVAMEGINPEIGIINPDDENAVVDAVTLTAIYDGNNPVKKP